MIFLTFYASIIGLIRFIGIGVGNEDARASFVFTSVLTMTFSVILKIFGYDFKDFGTFFIVLMTLSIFFLIYFYYSKNLNKKKINKWLNENDTSKKLIFGSVYLILTIIITITFFKLNA